MRLAGIFPGRGLIDISIVRRNSCLVSGPSSVDIACGLFGWKCPFGAYFSCVWLDLTVGNILWCIGCTQTLLFLSKIIEIEKKIINSLKMLLSCLKYSHIFFLNRQKAIFHILSPNFCIFGLKVDLD
jgi:hypothetical protein